MSAIVTVVSTVLRDESLRKVRAPFRRAHWKYTNHVLYLLGYEQVDIIATISSGGKYYGRFVPLYAITVKRGFLFLGKLKKK